jgi:hypothetical protein
MDEVSDFECGNIKMAFSSFPSGADPEQYS